MKEDGKSYSSELEQEDLNRAICQVLLRGLDRILNDRQNEEIVEEVKENGNVKSIWHD